MSSGKRKRLEELLEKAPPLPIPPAPPAGESKREPFRRSASEEPYFAHVSRRASKAKQAPLGMAASRTMPDFQKKKRLFHQYLSRQERWDHLVDTVRQTLATRSRTMKRPEEYKRVLQMLQDPEIQEIVKSSEEDPTLRLLPQNKKAWDLVRSLLMAEWPLGYEDQDILEQSPRREGVYARSEIKHPLTLKDPEEGQRFVPSVVLRDRKPSSSSSSSFSPYSSSSSDFPWEETKSSTLFPGEASESYLDRQLAYYRSLPSNIRDLIKYSVIQNRQLTDQMRFYLEELGEAYKKQDQKRVRQVEEGYKKAKQNMSLLNQAIVNAPLTEEDLILYRGQRELGPGNDMLSILTSLSTPIPTSFQLPEYLSFDNNLTLSLFGRSHSGKGYWGPFCCLWRVFVPKGTPLLFVEDRDHVLVPRKSVLTMIDKRTIRVPMKGKEVVLMMYDMTLRYPRRRS